MPEWLTSSFASNTSHTLREVIARSLVAAICGGLVALIYRLSHGRHKHDPQPLSTTLLILTILIALVSMVIGDSVARAFSLVGALSIVRFRTVVDDTRDTAFVIFAVVVGMAAGIGLMLVPIVGIPLVGVVSIAVSRGPRAESQAMTDAMPFKLIVRLGLGHAPDALTECLSRHLAAYVVTSVETVRQGAAIDIAYRAALRDRNAMTNFVAELNRFEGVQGVELHS